MGKEWHRPVTPLSGWYPRSLRLESIPFLLPPFPEKDRREGGRERQRRKRAMTTGEYLIAVGDHTAAECLCMPVRNSTTFRCRFNTLVCRGMKPIVNFGCGQSASMETKLVIVFQLHCLSAPFSGIQVTRGKGKSFRSDSNSLWPQISLRLSEKTRMPCRHIASLSSQFEPD